MLEPCTLPLEPGARIDGGPPVLNRTTLPMMPSGHQRMNRCVGDGKVHATRIRAIPPATIQSLSPSPAPLHLRPWARGWQRQDVQALAHRQGSSLARQAGHSSGVPGPAGRRPGHEQDRPHLMEPPDQQGNPEAAEEVPPPFGRAHECHSGVKGWAQRQQV